MQIDPVNMTNASDDIIVAYLGCVWRAANMLKPVGIDQLVLWVAAVFMPRQPLQDGMPTMMGVQMERLVWTALLLSAPPAGGV